MKHFIYFIAVVLSATVVGCNRDKQISAMLRSENINDIILGCEKAGESGKMKFVPLLLNNAADLRTSTSLWHYGVSVYEAKMKALQKIFKREPPEEIRFHFVDSTIIRFYTELFLSSP